MPLRRFGRGPWYRGGVHHSYVPANVFVSIGCGVYLLFFGSFLLLSGTIMTVTATFGPFKTIGPIALSIGIILVLVAVIMCIVVGYLAKKQQDRRHEQSQQPLNAGAPVQPPPPSAYPHQQAPQHFYPTVPSAPTQMPDQLSSEEKHNQHSQSQCPPQPTNYYPDTSYASPPEYPCPPPSYPESTARPTYPDHVQPVIAGCQPTPG